MNMLLFGEEAYPKPPLKQKAGLSDLDVQDNLLRKKNPFALNEDVVASVVEKLKTGRQGLFLLAVSQCFNCLFIPLYGCLVPVILSKFKYSFRQEEGE